MVSRLVASYVLYIHIADDSTIVFITRRNILGTSSCVKSRGTMLSQETSLMMWYIKTGLKRNGCPYMACKMHTTIKFKINSWEEILMEYESKFQLITQLCDLKIMGHFPSAPVCALNRLLVLVQRLLIYNSTKIQVDWFVDKVLFWKYARHAELDVVRTYLNGCENKSIFIFHATKIYFIFSLNL